jgi:hypothetical protein
MDSFNASLKFTAHVLFAPVQAVVSFFAPWEPKKPIQNLPLRHNLPAYSAIQNEAKNHPPGAANHPHFRSNAKPTAPGQARHVRVLDATCAAQSAGRMVISGRLSEVCAELDRLSRQEASIGETPNQALAAAPIR